MRFHLRYASGPVKELEVDTLDDLIALADQEDSGIIVWPSSHDYTGLRVLTVYDYYLE